MILKTERSKMLKGIDVSKWQKLNDYGDSVELGHTDFMIVKATEGKTYNDPMFEYHIAEAIRRGMLIGAYHYARPENNGAEVEAIHFVTRVKELNLIGRAILALDYEGVAHNYGETWALQFLNKVFELTGVRPLIYMGGSQVKKYPSVAKANYGLWVARWGSEPSQSYIKPWTVKALWQLRGAPLDLDYFYGTRQTWEKYAMPVKNVEETKVEEPEQESEDKEEIGEHHCGCSLCEAVREIVKEELSKVKE